MKTIISMLNILNTIIKRANFVLVLFLFVDTGTLWLINTENTLEADYKPKDMVYVSGHPMCREVKDAYLKMQEDIKKSGIKNPILQSAYRPQKYQRFLFDEKYKTLRCLGYNEAEAHQLAAKAVAPPGSSEHQTGLAIDLSTDGKLSVHFGSTEAGIWLNNNCHRYGFIIRYPKDKTGITKIMYEPWHLRYVGYPHSSYMKEHNLCLEEYIEYLKEHRLLIYWINEESYYRISYKENMAGYDGNGTISSLGAAGEAYVVVDLRLHNHLLSGIFTENSKESRQGEIFCE